MTSQPQIHSNTYTQMEPLPAKKHVAIVEDAYPEQESHTPKTRSRAGTLPSFENLPVNVEDQQLTRDRSGSLQHNIDGQSNNTYSNSWKPHSNLLQHLQGKGIPASPDMENSKNMDEGVVRTLGILGLDEFSEGSISPKEGRSSKSSLGHSAEPSPRLNQSNLSSFPVPSSLGQNTSPTVTFLQSDSSRPHLDRNGVLPPPLRTQRSFSIANGGTYDDVLNSADLYLNRPRAQSVSINSFPLPNSGPMTAIGTMSQPFQFSPISDDIGDPFSAGAHRISMDQVQEMDRNLARQSEITLLKGSGNRKLNIDIGKDGIGNSLQGMMSNSKQDGTMRRDSQEMLESQNQDHTIPTRSLWIGNIDPNITTNDLMSLFTPYGTIESLRLLPDKECGFINFTNVEDAVRARDDMQGGRLGNCIIKVGFGKADNFIPEGQVSSPTRALWIGNISASTTPSVLQAAFMKFGGIESSRILTHKNCGFVNFEKLDDAIRAKKAMNGMEINGAVVRIGYAKEPPSKTEISSLTVSRTSRIGNFQQQEGIGYNEDTNTKWKNKDLGFFTSLGDNLGANSAAVISAQLAPQIILDEKEKVNLSPLDSSKAVVGTESSKDSFIRESIFGKREMGSNINGGVNVGNNHKFEELGDHFQGAMSLLDNQRGGENIPSSFNIDAQPNCSQDDGGYQGTYYFDDTFQYASCIPPLPEPSPHRKIDQNRLREIRKKLDAHFSPKDLETAYNEVIDDVVDLSTDYIGNTVVQRLIERCGDPQRLRIIELLAPHMAAIGIHKNGTWVIQKMIDYARTSSQMQLIVVALKALTPPLLLDQFGNYVVQCCLRLGSQRNQFVFDAMAARCWEVAQGRFGARAMRACLESQFTSKKQQKQVAISVVQNSPLLATNPNGALLITWLLESSSLPGRFRVLAPKMASQISTFCTHKLASNTVLKIVNQRIEPDAREMILHSLFFNDLTILEEVLADQVHGVGLVQKILMSQAVEDKDKTKIAERVRWCLARLNVGANIQSGPYKRLSDELCLVNGDDPSSGQHSSGMFRSVKTGMNLITNPGMLNVSGEHSLQPHSAHVGSLAGSMGMSFFRGPRSASVYVNNPMNPIPGTYQQGNNPMSGRSPTSSNLMPPPSNNAMMQSTGMQSQGVGNMMFNQAPMYMNSNYLVGYGMNGSMTPRNGPASAGLVSGNDFSSAYFGQIPPVCPPPPLGVVPFPSQNMDSLMATSNMSSIPVASRSNFSNSTGLPMSLSNPVTGHPSYEATEGHRGGSGMEGTPDRASNTPTPTPAASHYL